MILIKATKMHYSPIENFYIIDVITRMPRLRQEKRNRIVFIRRFDLPFNDIDNGRLRRLEINPRRLAATSGNSRGTPSAEVIWQ